MSSDPSIYIEVLAYQRDLTITDDATTLAVLAKHKTEADMDIPAGQIDVKVFQDGGLSRRMASMPKLAAFCEREAKALLRFVMKAGADGELAADIVQASFLDALPTWKTICELRAWLRKVAQRKLMRPRDRTRTREDPVEKLPDGEQLLPSGHRAELLRPDAVMELSEEAQRGYG